MQLALKKNFQISYIRFIACIWCRKDFHDFLIYFIASLIFFILIIFIEHNGIKYIGICKMISLLFIDLILKTLFLRWKMLLGIFCAIYFHKRNNKSILMLLPANNFLWINIIETKKYLLYFSHTLVTCLLKIDKFA